MVPSPAQELLLELADPRPCRNRLDRVRLDRQPVGADPHLALTDVYRPALEVHLVAHQVPAALQEAAPVGAGVKADDVVGEDAVVDLLSDHGGQDAPGIRLAPGDVDEV